MNSSFLEQLRGPNSGGDLRLDVERSLLVDESSGETFPVIDGIPRFVASEHLASFGLQWNKYEVAHDDEDRATFQAKTGMPLGDLSGLRVLDAGCGGGRYSKIAGEAGAAVIGADHTTAVEKAARLCGAFAGGPVCASGPQKIAARTGVV